MSTRNNLSISSYKCEIVNAVKNNRVVIIVGQTGCGKSTQVPQYLHERKIEIGLSKTDMIACLHPRSVAATNLASRVAVETNTKLGTLVGYRIRFYKEYGNKTQIMYMTAGYMTRLLCINKKSGRFGIVIIDEAHERSIQNDIIMGQMKTLLKAGDPVKLVIMSATMNVDEIKDYYPMAEVINVGYKVDIVEVIYRLPERNNYIETIVKIIEEIENVKDPGHILIFLPNENKVRACKSVIKSKFHRFLVLKFYSSMDREDKLKVFRNYGMRRKIICATNVAETSLTIEGVNFVIDSGLVMRVVYNHELRLENWVTAKISRAEAEQRKGRTGRTGPGKCFRLFKQFDIEPDTKLLSVFQNINWFANLNQEIQKNMVKNIAKEFRLNELEQICEMPKELLCILARNVYNVDRIINYFKKAYAKVNHSSPEFKSLLYEKLKKCLQKVIYIKSSNEVNKNNLVENMINIYNVAQLLCISKSVLPQFKNPKTEGDFFLKLENILDEREISNNLIFEFNYSPYPLPEIRIADLGSLILNLKLMGQSNVMDFPYIVVPDGSSVSMAEQHLKDLALVNEDGSLTRLGSEVGNLPLSPPLGKIAMLGSQSPSRVEIFRILAMLSVKNIFKDPFDDKSVTFDSLNGDLFKLLNIFEEALSNGFNKEWCKENGLIRSNLQYAYLVTTQFEQLLLPLQFKDQFIGDTIDFEIKTIFLCGLFDKLAFKIQKQEMEKNNDGENKRLQNVFSLVNRRECQIEKVSCLDTSVDIVMPTVLKMSNNRMIMMKNCTSIDTDILYRINPQYFNIPTHLWNEVLSMLSETHHI